MLNKINPDLTHNNYSILRTKKQSGLAFYFMAFVVGILTFIFALLLLKFGIWSVATTISLIKNYWVFIVIGIVGLIFLKAILRKKQLVVTPPRYDSYPEY